MSKQGIKLLAHDIIETNDCNFSVLALHIRDDISVISLYTPITGDYILLRN